MDTYKKVIIKNLVNGNRNLTEQQQKSYDKINKAVEYAWNNWDAGIVATYYKGNKPAHPNREFIENWVDNEDFEIDGLDEALLKELFG